MVEFLNRQRTLLGAAYPILAVVIVHRLVEVAISITPLRLDDVTWRFGATGLLIGAAPMIALAVALIFIVASLLDHRIGARWVGIIAIVFGVIVAVSVLSFGLDALQVRRMIREDAKPGFDDASLKSLMIAVLFVPTLLWTGWKGIQFARGASERRDVDGPPIVVGG